jgi:hypothetical protein
VAKRRDTGEFQCTVVKLRTAMRLILPFAERPIVELVDAGYASATSAFDLERVANFLKTLADAVKSRAPLREAA